jgi:molybdenum cofactor guanylyltransferase
MLAYPRNYDALVPRSIKAHKTRNALNAETLHAIYSRQCLDLLQEKLKQGIRSIADFRGAISVTFAGTEAVSQYDANGHSFLNINTPDDLENLEQLVQVFLNRTY